MHDTANLTVWKFSPVARPDDPAWQGRPIWVELRIAAPTSGAAMLAAERHFQQACGVTETASQDGQQTRSGFDDLKLYRIDRLEQAPPGSSSEGVISEERLGPA